MIWSKVILPKFWKLQILAVIWVLIPRVCLNQQTNYSIKLPIPNKNKIYAKKDLYCNNINLSQRYQDSDSAYILCHPVLVYLPVEMCVWKIISNQVPTDSTCQDQHSSSSSSITANSPDFHKAWTMAETDNHIKHIVAGCHLVLFHTWDLSPTLLPWNSMISAILEYIIWYQVIIVYSC